MADVAGRRAGERRRGAAEPGRGYRDRGQIMLVTALSLAILFVALALILNTAIYTENLATRSSDIGGGTDAVRYHDAARDGVGGVVEYANYHNNTSHGDLQAELRNGTDDFGNYSSRQFALGDRAVETNLDSTVNGTRVVQTDDSRNFSDASGTSDWTVATSVNNTRVFRMQVYVSALDTLGGTPFQVVLDDGVREWNMTISESILTAGDIVVTVAGPTASGSCSTSLSPAWIDVTEGTLGGEPCPPLRSFAGGLTPPYEVRLSNGSDITGTYTLVVDNSTLANSPGPHLNSPGAGQPFATHAIYSANVTVVYQTSRLHYESTVRVAPEEAGDD